MPTSESEQTAPAMGSFDPEGEFPFDVADHVAYLIAMISRLREVALDEALRQYGLNIGLARVLAALGRLGACAMTELATLVAADRTTLTRSADHLIKLGLVRRVSDAKDRRQVKLELTPKGRRVHDEAVGHLYDLNARLLEVMSLREGREVARLLQRIVGVLAPNALIRERIIHFSRNGQSGDVAPP